MQKQPISKLALVVSRLLNFCTWVLSPLTYSIVKLVMLLVSVNVASYRQFVNIYNWYGQSKNNLYPKWTKWSFNGSMLDFGYFCTNKFVHFMHVIISKVLKLPLICTQICYDRCIAQQEKLIKTLIFDTIWIVAFPIFSFIFHRKVLLRGLSYIQLRRPIGTD